MNTIIVKQDKVYGILRNYPVCDKAKIFAQLVGRKTLYDSDLDLIRSLGFEIEYTNEFQSTK